MLPGGETEAAPPSSRLIPGHTSPAPPTQPLGAKPGSSQQPYAALSPLATLQLHGKPCPTPSKSGHLHQQAAPPAQHPQHNTPKQPSRPYYNKPPGAKKEGNQAVKRKKKQKQQKPNNKAKIIIKTENNGPGKTASRASRAAACLFGCGRSGREIPARRQPGSLAAAPRPLPPRLRGHAHPDPAAVAGLQCTKGSAFKAHGPISPNPTGS